MFQCAVRETDDLDDSFALVVHDGTFVIAVRHGLLTREDLNLLERLMQRGLAELLTLNQFAVTA